MHLCTIIPQMSFKSGNKQITDHDLTLLRVQGDCSVDNLRRCIPSNKQTDTRLNEPLGG